MVLTEAIEMKETNYETEEIEFTKTLFKGIVKYPEEVKVVRTVDEDGVFIRVWVKKSDMGLVIGKSGVSASALKLLIKLFGLNHDAKISVKIEEPE